MTEREYLLALSAFKYFGPVRTKLITSYFGSAKNAWNSDKDSLKEINLTDKVLSSFLDFKANFDFESYFGDLEKHSVKFTTVNESDYPENLKGIENPPQVLYYKGNLKKFDTRGIAVIGTRKMSTYGREACYKFASELASWGITIISGLALGIDAVAHKACIDVQGRGLVVLASGLDIISPYTNKWIADKIVEQGGAILSEYPLKTPPFKTSFPARNRIISGLSKGVLVVEGMRKSGTILTAISAAEQGRTVFAIPGQIFSPMSQAPHYLIQNGAKLVNSAKDILDELDLDFSVDTEVVERVMPSNKNEAEVAGLLDLEPLHIDELCRILRLTTSELSASLTVMELKGLVKNLGGGVYKKL